MPYHWSEAELEQLQGLKQMFINDLSALKSTLVTVHERVTKYVQSHPELYPDPSFFSYPLLEWAILIFQTRSFKYPDSETSALVPYNDMFNHASGWTRVTNSVFSLTSFSFFPSFLSFSFSFSFSDIQV